MHLASHASPWRVAGPRRRPHVRVGARDGKVVASPGDREAEVNNGLLCVKGYHVG